MLNWMKKIFVTFAAALTFGTVAPNSHAPNDRSQSSKSNRLEKSPSEINVEAEAAKTDESKETVNAVPSSWQEIAASVSNTDELKDQFVDYTVNHAEKQGFKKFGSVIGGQVGNEYRDEILPKVGQVMETIASKYDEDTLRNLKLSQSPSGGFGEKIFHIYDTRSGQDLVRFHVRRDHPPKDGYWFNFHYHLNSDQFQSHHDLGKIFWDKDTPPQWKA